MLRKDVLGGVCIISTQNALRSQISEFYEYCRRVGYLDSVFKLKGKLG